MPSAERSESGARERPAYENDRYWNQRLEKDFSLAGGRSRGRRSGV